MWPAVLSNLAFDRWLGRPLPYQLPNLIKSTPLAEHGPFLEILYTYYK